MFLASWAQSAHAISSNDSSVGRSGLPLSLPIESSFEAMERSKAEGAKNTQMNGETEPLFPRLHVSETEKAGPRAPPRNKMALFEQFTVPSHQFVQPSRTSTTLSNQRQQCVPSDNRHPYLSYNVPSLVGCSNINLVAPSHSQSSHCVSSCVTSSGNTSAADGESQRVLRSVGVSITTTKEDGSHLMELKAKVAPNDNIPTEDLPTAEATDMQCLPNTMAVESAEMPVITNFMNSLQETMSIVEEMSTCLVVESQNCGDQGNAGPTGSTSIEDVQLKQMALKASACVLDEHLTSCERSVYAAAATNLCKAMSDDELLNVDDLAEGGTNNGVWASKGGSLETEEQIPSPSGSFFIENEQSTSTSRQLSGPPHISKGTQKSPSVGEKGDGDANELSDDSLLIEKGESVGESQNDQINSTEASELSQHVTGCRGSSYGSSSSVLAAQAIKPKDVIRAVGQQQFWKARKALLRQQRIFSDQVFQLHKLIKVQQLLAEMPGTFTDEEMSFGAMDERAASPSHPKIIAREHDCGEKAHNTGLGLKESDEGQASERQTQLEVTQKPETFAAVGKEGRGLKSYSPNFGPGGISAWGYPSLGMGQWMGPVAVQGRPSAYQPFAGTFTQGAPYGGLYGLATLGPVSPMVPPGIPYSGPRSQTWEEMSSNHGSAAGHNHQAAPTMCHTPSHMANDLSGAWHYMHFYNLYHNQRSHFSMSEKDVPTGSGASINNQGPVKTVCSRMQYPGGQASHVGRLNTNGLENCVHQSESSLPAAAAGSKFKASTCMPSTPVCRKSDSLYHEVKHPTQNLNRNGMLGQCEATKAGGKDKAKTTAVRWLKPAEHSNQVPFNHGHSEETFVEISSNQTGNALDLFPLVPSLSPNEQSGSKQQSEHWQGRVIKAVPHPAVAASQSAAGILLSLQQERKH